MDRDSFIIYIKTKNVYEDIANDVEKRFDTSNYEVIRPLPKGKNKAVIGLMNDELGGKIMADFAALRPRCKRDKEVCNKKILNVMIIKIAY